MYFPGEQSEYIDSLTKRYNSTSRELHRYASFSGESLDIFPHTDIRAVLSPQQIALIEDGVVYVSKEDKMAFILQKGDFLFHSNRTQEDGLAMISEDCLTLKTINPARFLEDLQHNTHLLQNWQTLLLLQTAILANAYANTIKYGLLPTAGFLRFEPGEKMIKEGEDAEYVYTLLRGTANVLSGHTEVGKIRQGEIFGALAALTNKKRNASVIALTPCTLLSVPKDQFIDLVKARPETCLKMIKTMARQISELNSKLQEQDHHHYL